MDQILNRVIKPPRTRPNRHLVSLSVVAILLIAAGLVFWEKSKFDQKSASPKKTPARSETSYSAPAELPPLPDADRDRCLIAQSKDCTEAFNQQNWAKVADLTYEPVVKLCGGPAAMVKLMTRESAQGSPDGFSAGEASIGDIKQIVTDRGKIFATVEQDLTMGTPAGDCFVAAWLLCISSDGGREWKFVSIADPDRMRKIMPEIPLQLDLPKQSKPQLIHPQNRMPGQK